MGVTIHFEGNLKSKESLQKVVSRAKQFALANDWTFTIFEEENKILERVRDEENWDYQGSTTGILIHIDSSCDPLNLEFDKDLYIQEYCKTQFVNANLHITIVDLLRQIEPHFTTLKIDDEGEYWDTGDIVILQTHLDNCFKAIEDAKQEDSSLQGPFRLDDGRSFSFSATKYFWAAKHN